MPVYGELTKKDIEEIRRIVKEEISHVDQRISIFEKSIDKRFEQIDKRFEQIDKRFGDMFTFLWIITAIFTALTLGNMGFAYWDRRTIIRKAKAETTEEIEKEGRLRDLIKALRELSKTDQQLAQVLKNFNLM